MSTYFLSYSRSDEVIALRFANDIIAAGIAVWVDQYDIRPSEHWDRAVEAAVQRCTGLIVLLSPRSSASPNVADEVSVAIERGKAIIPILVEKCTVPLRMTRMQFIDATSDYQRALQRCLDEMGRNTLATSEDESGPALLPASIPQLSPAVTEAATRRLTVLLGPIAAVFVRTAAARAGSEAELYAALASKIPNVIQRESFLRLAIAANPTATVQAPSVTPVPAAKPAAAALAADEVDRIVTVLTRYLGPIAAYLVRREQQASSSTSDLRSRLASLLPNERAKADFLKQIDPA